MTKGKIGVLDPNGRWDTANGYNYVFENIRCKKNIFPDQFIIGSGCFFNFFVNEFVPSCCIYEGYDQYSKNVNMININEFVCNAGDITPQYYKVHNLKINNVGNFAYLMLFIVIR